MRDFTVTLTGPELWAAISAIDAEVERQRRYATLADQAGLPGLAAAEHRRANDLSSAAAKLRHAELVATASKRSAA